MNGLCEPVVTFLIAYPIIHTVCLMNRILNKVIILQENIDCEIEDVHIACLGMTMKGQICTHQEF
jgi:hypothetical protein